MEQPTKERIQTMIRGGKTTEAIEMLKNLLKGDIPLPNMTQDECHYLIGNAYRKNGDWKEALNSYQKALEINAESPAKQARRAVIDILEFYYKDMHNP